MSRRFGIQPLWSVLVAPDAAFASLQQRAAVGVPLTLIGLIATALLYFQSAFVQTALQQVPAPLAGTSGVEAFPAWLRWLRLALLLAAPLGIFVRALAFGSLLHVLQDAAGGHGEWRSCVALAVLAETVFLVESACTLSLLAWTRPQSLEALHAMRLRAGIDLFWEPGWAPLRQLTATVNLFLLWWGWLLWKGTRSLSGLSRARAILPVLPLWAISVILRLLLPSR